MKTSINGYFKAFLMKDLPRELRESIYTAALALRPDNGSLHLLLALGTHNFLKHGDFRSTVEIYCSINARITKENKDMLRKPCVANTFGRQNTTTSSVNKSSK